MQGVDVGGSHKSQQSGYEAFGVVNQARVMTDGVDTTEGSGGAGFYQDFFAQNEVAVSAAGQDVSMNTPGAAIISTIKSGGNRFSGIENIAYEPGSFVGNNIDEPDGGARIHRPAEPAVLRGARRPRRSDHSTTSCGSTRPTTISRSTRRCQAFRRMIATDLGRLQQLHDEGKLQAQSTRTR